MLPALDKNNSKSLRFLKYENSMRYTFSILSCALFLLFRTTSFAETIKWSGYEWEVRSTHGEPAGPGPNIYSDSKENIFIDSKGHLHLKIVKNNIDKWTCSEISLTKSLGYGTYEWEVASKYDDFQKNVVAGFFIYQSPNEVAKQLSRKTGDGKADTPHEIDIELTNAWGDGNLFFATHDPDIKSPVFDFYQKLNGSYTTHRFKWKPKSIKWESYHGHVAKQTSPKNPITEQRDGKSKGTPASITYDGNVIPKASSEKTRINFWIFGDKSSPKAPSLTREEELVIHNFYFTPATKN